MEQGPVEQTIIRQSLAMRQPLPDKIQNAPSLIIGLELYYQAFWDLTTCRSTGWSVAPIPWSAIKEYGSVYEFDDEQKEALYFLVRQMDNAYMDYRVSKSQEK